MTHRGNGSMPKAPSKVPSFVSSTGNRATNATIAARATGVNGKRLGDRRTRRNPMPMPRKLDSSTKFVR